MFSQNQKNSDVKCGPDHLGLITHFVSDKFAAEKWGCVAPSRRVITQRLPPSPLTQSQDTVKRKVTLFCALA